MPFRPKLYAYGVIAAGAALLAGAIVRWSPPRPSSLLVYLLFTVLVSWVKLRLPGMEGTFSVNFVVLLFGVTHFTLPETVLAASLGAVIQTTCNTRNRPTVVQVLFNIANFTLSAGACYLVLQMAQPWGLQRYAPARLALIACVYFVVNTMLVSGILSLLQGQSLLAVVRAWYVWSFPYYLIGVALVSFLPVPGQALQAEAPLVLIPLIWLVHFFVGLPAGTAPEATATAGQGLPAPARLYVSAVLTAGLVLLIAAGLQWESREPLRFVAYLLLASAAATMKVRLPGIRETISVSFVVVLAMIAALGFAEAVVISVPVGIVQCLWRPKRSPTTLQVLFNAAAVALSTAIAYIACHQLLGRRVSQSVVAMVVVATLVKYCSSTAMVAAVLSLAGQKPLSALWQHCYFWVFPYYLVGAAAAGLMISTSRAVGWQLSLAIVLPLMSLVYVSYKIHVSSAAKAHTQEA